MTARQLIVLGAMPSRDENGRALPAKLRFYVRDTATPATVYTSSALTTAHDWPIISDSAGRFDPIWADDASSFDVGWSDLATDTNIATYTNVETLQSSVTVSAELAQTAADAAEASATEAAASAVEAAASLAAAEAFIADVGDVSAAVTAAELAETHAETAETNAAASAVAAAASAASAANIGKHALWIPAAGMQPRTTNGAATGLVETTTNKVMLRSLDFDASTIEYAQVFVTMPKAWNEGTVTFIPVWSHAATTTNFKVSWGLQGVALSDDDAGDAAFGTAIYSNDTGGTTNDIYKGPESAAITISGTPTAEDVVVFQVLRKADDGTNDTLAIDARLHGIVIYLTTTAGNDA